MAHAPQTHNGTARRHLREQAATLAARGRPLAEIAVALAQTAELWRRQGADLPADTVGRLLAAIGCPTVSPARLAPVTEQIRRAHALAGWLTIHAAQPLAGLIVDAAESLLLAQHEEDIPCV